MALNPKHTGRASSMAGGLAFGVTMSLLLMIVMAAALAKLVEKEIIAETQIGYGVMVLLLLSTFAGSKLAWSKTKRRRLATCMAAGGIYFLVLLSITALFFGGQYEGVGVTAPLILAGSGLASLPASQKKRAGKGYKIPLSNG